MKTQSDWMSAFFPGEGRFEDRAEVDLVDSLRGGTTDLPLVRALLRHPDERLRGCVAWALNELTANLSDYLPAVYDGFDDPSDEVRYWCALALQQVPDSGKVAAIIREFSLLKDTAYWVRCAAADVIHALGRAQFAMALDADPVAFGLTPEKAAVVSAIQAELRQGYSGLPAGGTTRRFPGRQPLQGLAEIGYAMRLGYCWAEIAQSMKSELQGSSLDARCYLAERARELIEGAIDAVRSLAIDSEPGVRRRSWLALQGIMCEVGRWQRHLPAAAKDDDKTVRIVCFSHLTYLVPREVTSTVIAASRKPSDGRDRTEPLEALKHLAWTADQVLGIDSDTLQALLTALDDSSLSVDIRGEILEVVQAFAKIFLRPQIDIDWQAVLSRTIPRE